MTGAANKKYSFALEQGEGVLFRLKILKIFSLFGIAHLTYLLFTFELVTGGEYEERMDKFILECLQEIATAAQTIEKSVSKIVGWEVGNFQFGSRQAQQNKPQQGSASYQGDFSVQKLPKPESY